MNSCSSLIRKKRKIFFILATAILIPVVIKVLRMLMDHPNTPEGRWTNADEVLAGKAYFERTNPWKDTSPYAPFAWQYFIPMKEVTQWKEQYWDFYTILVKLGREKNGPFSVGEEANRVFTVIPLNQKLQPIGTNAVKCISQRLCPPHCLREITNAYMEISIADANALEKNFLSLKPSSREPFSSFTLAAEVIKSLFALQPATPLINLTVFNTIIGAKRQIAVEAIEENGTVCRDASGKIFMQEIK